MHKRSLLLSIFFFVSCLSFLCSLLPTYEVYEGKRVGAITILMENLPREAAFNQEHVLVKLSTKVGDPFSHLTFDYDLKTLFQEYDRVEPILEIQRGEVVITMRLWQNPMIRNITYDGNTQITTRTLQKELGIQVHTPFNREAFNKAFNKLKEYYIKKGYFEAELQYKLVHYSYTNEVDVEIVICEGRSGYISDIYFSGLSKSDESAILKMMTSKKYHFLTNWITGAGIYHEEALAHDQLVIINYIQDQGFADARATIQRKENKEGRLEIHINVVKGALFHFGEITVAGNTLFTVDEIKKHMVIQQGDPFSTTKLHDSVENIKKFYGKDGYIETTVNYALCLEGDRPTYNVNVTIREGEQFHIGVIRVLGNVFTNKNVILRESLLIPGEVFDSRCLRATQERLKAIGYFKSVNVYSVQTTEDQQLGKNYRDVVIEVDEDTTGSTNLFFGLSSLKDVYGGYEISENNFNHCGLWKWWREGISSLRGAGEYAHLRLQIGKKQKDCTFIWMDPYLNDSLWRFGCDVKYLNNRLQSNDYHVTSFGNSFFGSYPLDAYWTYGWKARFLHASVNIHKIDSEIAKIERENSGIIGGISNSLSFDSTDSASKPHNGLRSSMQFELGGIRRRANTDKTFPFLSVSYLGSYYYPVWRAGTLKVRQELKFLYPLGRGRPDFIPLSERFFLGGEDSVRGYKPFIIGPKFKKEKPNNEDEDPMGGVSSVLFSIEYMQQILPLFNVFVFFDAGAISMKSFHINKFCMGYGVGIRTEIMNHIPMTMGYAFPIKAKKEETQSLFYSIGGRF